MVATRQVVEMCGDCRELESALLLVADADGAHSERHLCASCLKDALYELVRIACRLRVRREGKVLRVTRDE